jgi:hypothetical protein
MISRLVNFKRAACGVLLSSLAIVGSGVAQETPTQVTTQNRTGDLPFSTAIGTDIEHVDLASGSLIVSIPILDTKGRGMDEHLSLNYNALFWVGAPRVDNQGNPYHIFKLEKRNGSLSPLGWELSLPAVTFLTRHIQCTSGVSGITNFWDTYIYEDSSGAKHPFIAQNGPAGQACPAQDMQGADTGAQGMWANLTTNNMYLANGALRSLSMGLHMQWTDPNGNQGSDITDTLGRTPYTQTNGTNQITFTVNDSSGTARNFTVNLGTTMIETSWGTGVGGTLRDFTPASSTSVISSVVLPNGQSYQFQYEPNSYGGITRIDFPTGAYVTYTWATADTSYKQYRYVSSRTLHVNGQAYTWNFTRTTFNETAGESVVDPLQQTTNYGIVHGAVTSVNVYSGTATGTPLRSYQIDYTHDGDPFNDPCFLGVGDPHIDPFVGNRPIRVTTTLENNQISKKEFDYELINYTYHVAHGCFGWNQSTAFTTSRGNVIEIREYDWGSGAAGSLIRKTDNLYGKNSDSNYTSRNIVN